MSAKVKQEYVEFRLAKLLTNQFAIIEDSYDGTDENISIISNINFGVDPDNKSIACLLMVQYEQNGKPFIIIKITIFFQMEEETWNALLEKSNVVKLPKGFAEHIAVITVGTLRGVLHAKTENTKFNKYFLPTINVHEIVKEDIVLNV